MSPETMPYQMDVSPLDTITYDQNKKIYVK